MPKGHITLMAEAGVTCPSVFFVGLTGIDLPSAPSPGLVVWGDLRATTDRPYIARTLGAYLDNIGSVEALFLQYLSKAVIFVRGPVQIEPSQAAESVNGLLIAKLAELQAWMLTLWLVKDNAVDADIGWMAIRLKGQDIVNNNRWSSIVSKADGSRDVMPFSREELQAAAKIPLVSGHWNEGRPLSLDISIVREPGVTKLSSKSLRFQRFLYFIDAARTSRDVAIKIAHYCTGLEAMVSSSQTELSHQVAERVSCLLHRLGGDRLSTFQLVKRAYGIRSKAVHGASFKEKEEEQLRDVSVKIDGICRSIARKYLEEKRFKIAVESGAGKFNEFWLRTTFLEVEE